MNCWICGKPATCTRNLTDPNWGKPITKKERRRCYCKECYMSETKREAEDRKLCIKLKKREMVRKAIKILEQQNTDMYKYKEAIEAVQDFVEDNPDKIDSSYEALAAMVLIQNRIAVKMQYKVGPYQVDFLLPDMLIVLEIDGDRHRNKKAEDSIRDQFIKRELGPHWEIIRITTDCLDQDAKKIPFAINKVLEYRETKHINWRTL